ncbi:MAG: H-X9-DG-CTERM domain-containing protein, partial [Fimbriiglobus sp.]
PCTSAGDAGPFRLTARSQHPGIVNLLLFDGSVRPVSDQVSRPVWQALASMAGREVPLPY